MAAPQSKPQPQPSRPATASQAGNDPALLWAIGGGVLLLAGLGGAAMMRRRTRVLDERDEWAGENVPEAYVAEPAVATPPLPDVEPRRVVTSSSPARAGTLEAMVAAPPSAENPFRTHKKRAARARFLLAQQQGQSADREVLVEPAVPPQTIHAEPQMQTVYRLGGGQGRNIGYKPQTR